MLNSKSIGAVGTGIASLVASHYSDVFLPVTVSISMAVLGGTIGMLYKEKKITIGKIILRTLLSIFFALLIFFGGHAIGAKWDWCAFLSGIAGFLGFWLLDKLEESSKKFYNKKEKEILNEG